MQFCTADILEPSVYKLAEMKAEENTGGMNSDYNINIYFLGNTKKGVIRCIGAVKSDI